MTDRVRNLPRRSFRWMTPWLALVLAGPAAVSWAAGMDDERAGEREPAFYETATVRARPLARATAAVTVIDRETIESLGAESVAELMRYVPGVSLASTGPRAGFATARIRGGDENFTSVLVDGVPLNDITDQVGGAVNLNGLSTAHVERIELVHGPLSSSFGSTGLAGAVNVITRRGRTASPEHSYAVSAGDDSTVLGAVGLSQGLADRDYFVGASWERQRDAVDAAGAEDEFEQWALQGRGRIELGDRAELRLSGRYATWDAEDYPEFSGGPRLGTGELRRSEHDELGLGLELRIGDAGRRHRIRASAYRHDLDRRSPFVPNPVDPFNSVPASIEETSFTTWRLGWTAPQLQAAGGRLNAGVDLRVEDGQNDGSFPDVPLDLSYRIDRETGGAFAEYVTERGNLLLEVGARVDIPEGFHAELSPRVGAVYRFPGGATRLRASLGRAFKLPSFFVLATPSFGNPGLDPEVAVGADAGVEHTFAAAGLTLGVTAFFNRFEDLIDFDDDAFMLVNLNEVETRGAELFVDWRPAARWFVHADATRQEFDERQSDPLPQRPEWSGALRLVWQIGERTRWNADAQWVSEAFDFQVPLDGTGTRPGYQLYGSTFMVDVAPVWTLYARVDNLADKAYEPYIGFPGPDRSFRLGMRRHASAAAEPSR